MPNDLADAVGAFAKLAGSDNPRAAQAHATAAGWASKGDSAARLARQISRDRLHLNVTGPSFNSPGGGRAAIRTAIMRGEENIESVWVLLENVGDRWAVEGVTEHGVVLGLYLAGQFSPVTSLRQLPSHPAALAWADAQLLALQSGQAHDPRLQRETADGTAAVVLQGVYHLAAVNRTAVVFEARRPDEKHGVPSQWVLHHLDDEVVVVAGGTVPGLDSLLEGVHAAWDTTIDPAAPLQDKVQALLGGMIEQFLGFFGLSGSLGDAGGPALLGFLQREVDAGRLPAGNLLDPDHLASVWGDQLPARVESRAQAEVYKALRAGGIDPTVIEVDSAAGKALVAEHADAIVRALFSGILLASSPAVGDEPPPPPSDVGAWVRAALASMTTE